MAVRSYRQISRNRHANGSLGSPVNESDGDHSLPTTPPNHTRGRWLQGPLIYHSDETFPIESSFSTVDSPVNAHKTSFCGHPSSQDTFDNPRVFVPDNALTTDIFDYPLGSTDTKSWHHEAWPASTQFPLDNWSQFGKQSPIYLLYALFHISGCLYNLVHVDKIADLALPQFAIDPQLRQIPIFDVEPNLLRAAQAPIQAMEATAPDTKWKSPLEEEQKHVAEDSSHLFASAPKKKSRTKTSKRRSKATKSRASTPLRRLSSLPPSPLASTGLGKWATVKEKNIKTRQRKKIYMYNKKTSLTKFKRFFENGAMTEADIFLESEISTLSSYQCFGSANPSLR